MNDIAVQVAYDLQALKSEENLIRQRLASNLTKQAEIASYNCYMGMGRTGIF